MRVHNAGNIQESVVKMSGDLTTLVDVFTRVSTKSEIAGAIRYALGR